MRNRRIGQYELLGLLGEGGIGQVYVARDIEIGRQVAIKTLRPEFARDRQFLVRFRAEAQSMGRLGHSNITTLYGLADRNEPAMAMELVRGHTLAALLGRVHRLSLRDSLAVTVQTIAGLSYAHREGVVHRDIKPDNLMVSERGLIKIMDFGISRVQGTRRLTRAGQIFGTLLYAPPEQIRGAEVDERGDLYSLAVVLYEMLAGTPPFNFENEYELQTAHLQMLPPPLTGRVRDLPPQIEAAIMRALAKRPEDRFSSVDEFGRALGVAAVAADAAEILQQLVRSVFRNTPSAATRLLPSGPGLNAQSREVEDGRGSSREPTGGRGREASLGDAPPRRRALPGLGAVPAAFRGPTILLAAAAVSVGLGIGYILLSAGPTPPPPSNAVANAKPELPGASPTTEAPKNKSSSRESTVMVEPGPAPGRGSTSPFQENSPPVVNKPPPYPPAPAKPSPPTAPAPAMQEAPTRPAPDISGVVQKIGSASVFTIAGEPVLLYGIDDPTTHGEHVSAVKAYLLATHGVVDCYRRGPPSKKQYQCFTGDEDLAILALRKGFAQLNGDAPSEYRALVSQLAAIPK